MRKAIATLTCIAAILPFGGVRASTASHTMADIARQELAKIASSYGVDPAAAMAAPQTFDVFNADGTTTTVTMTTAQILDRMDGLAVPRRATGPGLAPGVPETLVGDLTHFYISVGFSVPSSYAVTSSAAIPSTPGAVVPNPAGGLPLFTEYGGPVIQVKGGGWTLGGHFAGYAAGGINVDLAGGGPYAGPVLTLILDGTIDFVGHGSVAQPCIFSFFGICLLRAGLVLADGVALFDSTLPAGIPILP